MAQSLSSYLSAWSVSSISSLTSSTHDATSSDASPSIRRLRTRSRHLLIVRRFLTNPQLIPSSMCSSARSQPVKPACATTHVVKILMRLPRQGPGSSMRRRWQIEERKAGIFRLKQVVWRRSLACYRFGTRSVSALNVDPADCLSFRTSVGRPVAVQATKRT